MPEGKALLTRKSVAIPRGRKAQGRQLASPIRSSSSTPPPSPLPRCWIDVPRYHTRLRLGWDPSDQTSAPDPLATQDDTVAWLEMPESGLFRPLRNSFWIFPLFSFYSNLSRIHKTGDALVFCKLGHLSLLGLHHHSAPKECMWRMEKIWRKFMSRVAKIVVPGLVDSDHLIASKERWWRWLGLLDSFFGESVVVEARMASGKRRERRGERRGYLRKW